MATNSRHRKNHKQKVEARKKRLSEEKRKREKFQREFIMNLIKQEQQKGLFENSLPVDGPVIDGPIIDGPIIDGPIIDGPVIENTVEVVDVQEVTETVENSTEETQD
jgi:hypothetical protein